MAYGKNLLLLSIIFLVCSFALNLVGPVWPVYIKNSLNASMTELGFVFSLSNGVSAVMQITCGFLSDKYGRKRLHALGTLLAAFPPLMYALANNWVDLIPWVMLSGFATGLYLPMRWVIVADVSSPETMAKAYGWVNISWLAGSTIAPYIGGMIADSFGIRFPFYFYSLLIFAVFPLTLLMEETRRKPQAITAEKESEAHLNQGYLVALTMFSLINIIQGMGIGVTGPVISVFVLSQFPVDYTFIGILFAIGFGVASIVVQMPASKLSDAFERRRIIFIAIVASAPFFLLFAYSQNTNELIVLMFLSNAILNTSWPAFQTLMMDATPSSKWGLANGVSATTWWIGMMTGNALSGILWDNWGMYAPFWTSAIAVGLSATPLLLLKETRIKKNREEIQK
jgi:DHA1 family multidrug resistance protein-like MFS transporter